MLENHTISTQELLEAGVHFGHLKKKWNPKMRPYIFMERKGIHLIDLNKTQDKLYEAAAALYQIAKSGKKVLFVATKKQAKEVVMEAASRVNMPYVTERWLGGMLTNWATMKRSIKKMQSLDKMLKSESSVNITKKERLVMTRELDKLNRVLGGIANLQKQPQAIFIVDVDFEDIAVAEAKKLNLQTFGIVDTNSDPNSIDFPIPGNDDATKSISIITNFLADAIGKGLEEREREKAVREKEQAETAVVEGDEKKTSRKRKEASSSDEK